MSTACNSISIKLEAETSRVLIVHFLYRSFKMNNQMGLHLKITII
jgi:hypothetical protein